MTYFITYNSCPNYGYCHHCGRGGPQFVPWYPYTPGTTPYNPPFRWITTTSGTFTS